MIQKLSPKSFIELINGSIKLDKVSRYHPNFENINIGYEWVVKEFNYEKWQYTGSETRVKVTNVFKLDEVQQHLPKSVVNKLNYIYKFLEIEVL